MDTAYIQREPYGVALVMGAWNYPIQITVLPVLGAIAAGNCVVLKPSELAASTAKILEELIPKYLDNVSYSNKIKKKNIFIVNLEKLDSWPYKDNLFLVFKC